MSWRKELEEKFPGICGDIYCDAAVGKGWQPIVERTLEQLPRTIQVAQIKEKFGGLRIYIDKLDASDDEYDAASKLITEAEILCASTCEACGKPGERRGGGWIKTLCEGCNE